MRNKRILALLVALVSLLTLLPAASAANDVYVGQTFYFGNYEQDGNLRNGDEPILWRVYSVDYGSRTVRAVSEYGLDSMVYNRSTSTTSWHNSTIRSWLNSTFLSSAFTSAEQGQLNSVYVSNSSDYVYILSQWEIQQYLDTELLYATEYARQCGAYTASDTGTSSYWARVDSTSTFGVFVGAHGSFYDHGNKVTEFDNAVRPAICVSFDVALGRWTPSSSGNSSSGLLAMSNRPISTRSGPSTKYDELGTYWNDGGHTVTVLSRASGNDIWWLQVEFEYGGKTVRVYTGEQRIDIDVSRVLLGSVIAGAMGLLVLILSDGQADALWACAMLIGAAACFLGVSRRGMLLCSLMGLLVAQGAAGVSGVLRADVQPWTDAALLCASVSTVLAEIVRRTAIFLLTPPGVKGGHRG